jgi:hypothetical protein
MMLAMRTSQNWCTKSSPALRVTSSNTSSESNPIGPVTLNSPCFDVVASAVRPVSPGSSLLRRHEASPTSITEAGSKAIHNAISPDRRLGAAGPEGIVGRVLSRGVTSDVVNKALFDQRLEWGCIRFDLLNPEQSVSGVKQ